MYQLVVTLLIFGIFGTATAQVPGLELDKGGIRQKEKEIKSDLGVVFGTRQCGKLFLKNNINFAFIGKFCRRYYKLILHDCSGGNATLLEWRCEDCNTTDIPCSLAADGKRLRAEVDFIPTQDIEQLGLRIIIKFADEPPMQAYDGLLKNSKVIGGVLNTLHMSGRIGKEMQGKMLTSRWIMYRAMEENAPVELCLESEFEIY